MSYQWELDPSSLDDPRAIDRFWREQALSSEENREFFEGLVRGIAGRMPELDELIKKYLKNWKVDRLDKVDLALLRVAIFEMLFYKGKDPADPAVVINEALEIAKKFGTPKSAAFINGVLDNVAKDHGLSKSS
jgi:transcription antitermination protein NusB